MSNKFFDFLPALKLGMATIISVIVSSLGGYDVLLKTLLLLFICDFVSGIVRACIKKNVSSLKMRQGLLRKILIIMSVFIAVSADELIIKLFGQPINLFGREWFIRDVVICFYCLEEFVSIVENCAQAGLPIPKWLRSVLKQVNDSVTGNSTPKFIVEWLHSKLGITVKDKEKKEKQTDNKPSEEENITTE